MARSLRMYRTPSGAEPMLARLRERFPTVEFRLVPCPTDWFRLAIPAALPDGRTAYVGRGAWQKTRCRDLGRAAQ